MKDLPQDLTPQETTEDGFPGGSTAARYTGPVSSSTSPEMREGGGAFLPSHHSTLPRPVRQLSLFPVAHLLSTGNRKARLYHMCLKLGGPAFLNQQTGTVCLLGQS